MTPTRFLVCTALALVTLPCVAVETKEAPPPKPARSGDLTVEAANSFAMLALSCIDRPYPYKPERVLESKDAVHEPSADHPIFFGCFDWHSAAHGHWMLVRLLRLFPDAPFAPRAKQALATHFTTDRVLGEASFLGSEAQQLFERPYGWAWALRLAAELRSSKDATVQEWAREFAPVERMLVSRLTEYLPKLTFPVRTGAHPNTAFALAQALDYAKIVGDDGLAALAVKRSKELYLADKQCPVAYEPSGEDFFSPCLLEADLMRRVLPAAEFGKWLDGFLPGLAKGAIGNLSKPAEVTDPSDGKIVHLDGLNLVRAWTMKGIASALAPDDPRRARLLELAKTHAETGLARVSSGHYEGEHWLASFAVYLTTNVGL